MSIIATAVPILGGLLGGGGKDDERFAKNAAAYSLALQGDQAALTFLGARAEILPRQMIPGYGDTGGWATDTAKKDAAEKYNAAVAAQQGVTLGAPKPNTGIIGDLQTIADGFADRLGAAAGTAASSGQTGQAVQQVAGTTRLAVTLLAVAAVGAVGFYIYKNVK